MRDSASLLDDAEIAVYVDGKPVVSESREHDHELKKQDIQKKKRRQKPGFKFHMIGLKAGDLVIFDPLGIQVKVASDDRVEYEGRLYSLSSFTGTFLPADKQNNSGVYAGPKYFSYKGETLYKLRNESESQSLLTNRTMRLKTEGPVSRNNSRLWAQDLLVPSAVLCVIETLNTAGSAKVRREALD